MYGGSERNVCGIPPFSAPVALPSQNVLQSILEGLWTCVQYGISSVSRSSIVLAFYLALEEAYSFP